VVALDLWICRGTAGRALVCFSKKGAPRSDQSRKNDAYGATAAMRCANIRRLSCIGGGGIRWRIGGLIYVRQKIKDESLLILLAYIFFLLPWSNECYFDDILIFTHYKWI
jgi:hypothetical protein